MGDSFPVNEMLIPGNREAAQARAAAWVNCFREASMLAAANGMRLTRHSDQHYQLRQAFRELRRMGYECHRYRHGDNDASVLVERTDGATRAEILRGWNRRGGGGVIVNRGGQS